VRQLYGKNALVTGGAMGMGRSLAELLLREGMRVAVVDIWGDRWPSSFSAKE